MITIRKGTIALDSRRTAAKRAMVDNNRTEKTHTETPKVILSAPVVQINRSRFRRGSS
jgi:hypothetical protein